MHAVELSTVDFGAKNFEVDAFTTTNATGDTQQAKTCKNE